MSARKSAPAAAQPPDELCAQFLRYLEVERNASPHTLKVYRRALDEARARSGFADWRSCDADFFRGLLFDLMKAQVARSSIRQRFAALRSFYKFLGERRRLERNPLREVQLPKLDRKLPVVLNEKQVAALLDAPLTVEPARNAPRWIAQRDAAILELFYSSGLRLDELAQLDVADIDIFGESVRVLGKGRKQRVCPVGEPALNAISRYRHAAAVTDRKSVV